MDQTGTSTMVLTEETMTQYTDTMQGTVQINPNRFQSPAVA